MNSKICFSVMSAALCAVVFSGCGSAPVRVDARSNAGLVSTHDINAKDFQTAAMQSINSMLTSGVLNKNDGQKMVIALSVIKNSTKSHIDVQVLTNDIRQALLRSGKAQFTTAIRFGGGVDDVGTAEARDLANSDLVDQTTVQPNGTVIAPDMSLAGEVTQIKTKVGRNEESYFQLTLRLTNLRTGIEEWVENTEVMKQETNSWIGW